MIKSLLTGNDLRRMRLDAKLSVQRLADKVGVAKKTLQNWENDEGSPKVSQFILMAYYCKLDAGRYITALTQRRHPSQKIDLSHVKREGDD